MGQCSLADSRIALSVVFSVSLLVVIYTMRSNQSLEAQSSCQVQQCLCDCSSESLFEIMSTGFPNSTADCGKGVPELKEELKKDLAALTVEELNLLKAVANETMERTETLIFHTETASLQYQREAEKCTAAVETCESARERAESQLADEIKLSALWEERARKLV